MLKIIFVQIFHLLIITTITMTTCHIGNFP